MQYDFTLSFSLAGEALSGDELAGRLRAGGCDDALVGIGAPGRVGLSFTREAASREAAIRSALADVQRALPGAVVEMASSRGDPHVVSALELIRRVFGLSDGLLAEVCGGDACVSSDGEPERGGSMATQRIDRLWLAAVNWERSGFAAPGSALTAPTFHEKTLFDLLRADEVDVEAIQFVGGRMTMLREMAVPRAFVDPFL